jgi:hypothetical protein
MGGNDEMSRQEDLALASFLEGEIETDFFDRPVAPPYPKLPQYRPKGGPLGVDHGRLIQERETHRYGTIRIERMYEDGFADFRIFLDPKRYRAGTIVNGNYYPPDWTYDEEEKAPDDTDHGVFGGDSSGALATTISDPRSQRKHDNHSKLSRECQGLSTNSNGENDLHPALMGDFPIYEEDYEWPKLPKFPVDPVGPQQELFNGSNDKNSTDDWASGSDADAIANFLRGLDGD